MSSQNPQRVQSGALWETVVGYCRAIRRGEHIYVSGTAPLHPDGTVHTPGDAYAQTKRCLDIIRQALQGLNADLSQVVRTRMY